MDDLTFRKTVYAEPFTKDPEIIEAAAKDQKKQAFWDELKAMEIELQAAMNVQVPEHLAEKLILRQTLSEHKSATQKRPWYIALAASVVFASILSFSMLSSNANQLSDDVLAHMSHVDLELMKSAKVDLDSVNDKLASFNGQVDGELGEVVSANYCYLDKIKSLHVIIRGENGLTSLFVVPDSITDSIGKTFSDATYQGASFLLESAKVIIVGENKNDVERLEQRAKQTMSFSA
jgi:hypothetical protein